jgi:rhamnosyltransferase subunit B
MSHDQFDNAYRVKVLGVGDEVNARFRPGAVAVKLDRLLTDPAIASACRTIQQRFVSARDGIDETCDLAESLQNWQPRASDTIAAK